MVCYNISSSFDSIFTSYLFVDPRLKQLSEDRLNEWRKWFDSRLDDAIEAASTQQQPDIEQSKSMEFIIIFDFHTRMITIQSQSFQSLPFSQYLNLVKLQLTLLLDQFAQIIHNLSFSFIS